MTKVLILCTGNSCRSQMAEGFLQSFDSNLEVHSAGTKPAERVHPKAVDVMMPGEGGVQMYQNLKADEKLRNILIIMLSAIAKKTFSHYLKMLTARSPDPIPAPEAYLEKPPDAEELLRITASLIGR